jgi:hypothetical protein
MAMKYQWIIKFIVMMALLGGCASQPQRPPTPAATRPVGVEKHRSAVDVPPAKKTPPAAVESHPPEISPLGADQTSQQAQVSSDNSKTPASTDLPPQKPARRLGSTPAFKPESVPETAESKTVPNQPLEPTVKPKQNPAAGPIAKSSASASTEGTSHPARHAKAAVAEPAPVTKKPSVTKNKPLPVPTPDGHTTAPRTAASKATPSRPSSTEHKDATKADLKVKDRAQADSKSKSRTKTQLGMIKRRPPADTLNRDMSTWVFDEEHLPRTLAGGWVLDIRPDQLGNDRRCLLDSTKKPIFDGYDKSWIRLQITTDAIVVNTDSNVDTSYPKQGLRIDKGELVPFRPNLLDKKTTYTRKPALAAMANGKTLTISLGFWPTWPVTKTQFISIDLAGFKGAYTALKACTAAK